MISLLDKAKTKNTEFQGVRLMDELKKWIEENIDVLEDLLRMSDGENQWNYEVLMKCPKLGRIWKGT